MLIGALRLRNLGKGRVWCDVLTPGVLAEGGKKGAKPPVIVNVTDPRVSPIRQIPKVSLGESIRTVERVISQTPLHSPVISIIDASSYR